MYGPWPWPILLFGVVVGAVFLGYPLALLINRIERRLKFNAIVRATEGKYAGHVPPRPLPPRADGLDNVTILGPIERARTLKPKPLTPKRKPKPKGRS